MTSPDSPPHPTGRRSKPKGPDPVHGVLPVDKPRGMTSHDVVYKIRRHFNFRKTGHGGTLDPNATGLLPILIGRGTKVSDKIMGSDKIYRGVLRLGQRTDSQDADGETIGGSSPDGIREEEVRARFEALLGDQEQIPPMVSAVKKDGVPLYKLARQGKTVEREPRLIHIFECDLLRFDLPDVEFRLRCSKGTYVRTLCDDIGEALGCGGHLADLIREGTGGLTMEEAVSLDDVLSWDLEGLKQHLITLDRFAKRS